MTKNLYVLGDVHGNWDFIKWWIKVHQIEKGNIIQVGDFGIGFSDNDDEKLEELNTFIKEKNIILYIVRGNHDNPFRFMEDDCDLSHIKFLKDYSILELEGKRIFTLGGAISIDRSIRRVGVSWWPSEVLVYKEEKIKELKNIDIIITHTAPSFCSPTSWKTIVEDWAKMDPKLYHELPHERNLLTEAYNIIKENNDINKWYYGHYHLSNKAKHFGTEFISLGINEIQEIRETIIH